MMSAQLQQPSDPATSVISAQRSQLSESHSSVNGASPMPLVNRAAQSKSPYVQAQSNGPVAWQLLDDEAVTRARSENKLIFLSIGFLASHRKLSAPRS
jgi:hypothetical protein